MLASVKDIVFEFAKDMYHLFGKDMSRVVIYGSYARGDYSKESDIDVMILVKIPEAEIRDYTDDVADCAFGYLMKYGIDISPVVKNEEHFNYWVDTLPYYRNIRDEGVVVDQEILYLNLSLHGKLLIPKVLDQRLGKDYL